MKRIVWLSVFAQFTEITGRRNSEVFPSSPRVALVRFGVSVISAILEIS